MVLIFLAQTNESTAIVHTKQCDELDDGLGPESVERDQVMTFYGEACSAVELGDYSHTFSYPQKNIISDVKKYAERPRIVASGPIAGTAGSVILSLDLNSTILNNYLNYFPLAAGVRFGMKFRLQIASTPMWGGVLKLIYAPQGCPIVQTQLNQNRISMMPGVYVDICEQTSAILEVPWISFADFYPIPFNGNNFELGRVFFD